MELKFDKLTERAKEEMASIGPGGIEIKAAGIGGAVAMLLQSDQVELK